MKKEILRMENVISEELDTTNLDNFNLHMFQGEITGLIGMNDYGKEVLVKLICKNTPIKFGRIYFANLLVNSYHYSDGSSNKVYVIAQESKLVNDLTVIDNVFVLRKSFKKYIVNRRVLGIQLKQLLKELGVSLDPEAVCLDLTEYERCIAEVLKAVIQGVKLIIVNDLSNILSSDDFLNFKKLLVKMAKKNYSILLIGNHHEEIFPICDRVAFMQDGKVIKMLEKKELADEKVLPYIISFEDTQPSTEDTDKKATIYFHNISTSYLNKVSFSIPAGECIVLYDKSSKFQLDTIDFLSGEQEIVAGAIEFGHKVLNPKKMYRYFGDQIMVIGEDALRSMLYYDMSYIDNFCFLLDKKTNRTNITGKVKRSIQQEYYQELGLEIYANDLRELDKKSLYNLIYYRVHLQNPEIVFIVQPFSNADMYLRRHIIYLIRMLKRKGIAVVILAVSISDSLHVADRLLLLEEGSIKEEYFPDTFSQIRISD